MSNDDRVFQAVSPEKMDALRMQLAEEVEGPYREKLSQAHGEVDKYRNEYNDLRYELTFLKSEYEHSKEEHQRVLEELRAQHHAEVCISLSKHSLSTMICATSSPS